MPPAKHRTPIIPPDEKTWQTLSCDYTNVTRKTDFSPLKWTRCVRRKITLHVLGFAPSFPAAAVDGDGFCPGDNDYCHSVSQKQVGGWNGSGGNGGLPQLNVENGMGVVAIPMEGNVFPPAVTLLHV